MTGAAREVEHRQAQRTGHRRQHLRRGILESPFELGQVLRGHTSARRDIGDPLVAVTPLGSQLLTDHRTPQWLGLMPRGGGRTQRVDVIHGSTIITARLARNGVRSPRNTPT